MFGFDEARYQREQVYEGEHHQSHFTHELVAGGAAFEGMKLWEDHQRKEGATVNHAFAKEALAGFAAAEVDKLFESKGLDALDRERAKRDAKEKAETLYDQQYGNQAQWDPEQPPHPHHRRREEDW